MRTAHEAALIALSRVTIVISGCWEYQGARGSGGYGRIVYNGARRSASRAVAALHLGLDVDDTHTDVCHRCDNPPCINPDHLFLGTASDNTRDAISKGRRPASPPRRLADKCGRGHDMAQTRRTMSGGKTLCIVCQRARHAAGERRRRRERNERANALAN